jgi:hypothetical protein
MGLAAAQQFHPHRSGDRNRSGHAPTPVKQQPPPAAPSLRLVQGRPGRPGRRCGNRSAEEDIDPIASRYGIDANALRRVVRASAP